MGHLSCQHLHDGVCALTGCPAPPSLCLRCREDRTGLFRAKLEAVYARQMLRQRLAAAGEGFTCARYGGIQVDAEFCAVCRQNPALKQRLRNTQSAVLRELNPCLHRGDETGVEEVTCCGGKTREVTVYGCAKGREAHTYTCRTCPDYEPSSREKERPAVACVNWPDLWQIHQGQTILVLACGPSVLLPGEDPTPETVDPRQVERHVVLSTNWAWKWYGEICQYQLSYDPTPALGWRPAHLRLLTVRRPQRTMNVLERCQPYCVFPGCDYGEIAKGERLPTSRNSGFAALSMAAYMGAARIRVVGMDFCPRDGRMHFYHETDFDVTRRVKSFGRNQERVQADLTRLLAQIRGMGITVENLSPISALDWS